MPPVALRPHWPVCPPTGTGEPHATRRLGDSIHAYAVMAALAAEGRASAFVAYRPFAPLFANGALPVLASDHGTQWWSMPRAFRGPRHGEHVRDTMARAAGIGDRGLLDIELAVPPRLTTQRPYAVICPSAGAAYKEWPRQRWGAVVEFLLARDMDVFVCAMPGTPHIDVPRGATHLEMDVAALASLIAGARALIGPDSGHIHLADALRVPAAGIYAATSSRTYGPYHDRSLCVDMHAEAAGTLAGYDSAKHVPCHAMTAVSVERVLEALAGVTR
jgi:hypothetical protein